MFVMSENEHFYKWIEALIDEPLPRIMRDLLNISGYTSRLAILNTDSTWLQDIENFIRQNASSDFFKTRLQHGQQLQSYTIAPGYKGLFAAIKSRAHNNYNISEAPGQSVSLAEAVELLDNELRLLQRDYESAGMVQYQMRCKKSTGASGETLMKVSAMAGCPRCDQHFLLFMDDAQRQWILNSLISHFQRHHKPQNIHVPDLDLLPHYN